MKVLLFHKLYMLSNLHLQSASYVLNTLLTSDDDYNIIVPKMTIKAQNHIKNATNAMGNLDVNQFISYNKF